MEEAQLVVLVDFPETAGTQVFPPSVEILKSKVCVVGEVKVTVTLVFIV
jgi:hypothetical protein